MRPSISPFYVVYNFIICHLIVTVVSWPLSKTRPLPYILIQGDRLGSEATFLLTDFCETCFI